jgi:hypothetical protein
MMSEKGGAMKHIIGLIALIVILPFVFSATPIEKEQTDLWDTYEKILKPAKYVDLTHAFHPGIAVWQGFGGAEFKPSVAGPDSLPSPKPNWDVTYAS